MMVLDGAMIRLEHVSKEFRTPSGAVRALDDVSISVEEGHIFGIIGQSGAGKSTLVRLINLLERPSSGIVRLQGSDVTHARGPQLRALRRRIGMVFQHFNLLSSRTVAANVAYPLEIGGKLSRSEIASTVQGLLARVGLSAFARSYPHQLSGGQKQRVGIARALASSPSLLLCDEATSALDPQSTVAILDLLKEINRDLGMTVVIITHEMDVVRRICDKVAVLDHGRVVETGAVSDVFLKPLHEATLRILSETSGADVERISAEGDVVLTLLGEQAGTVVVSRALRRHHVDFAIVAGRAGSIGGARYLQLVLKLEGGEQTAALAALRQEGLRVEETPAARNPGNAEGGLRVT